MTLNPLVRIPDSDVLDPENQEVTETLSHAGGEGSGLSPEARHHLEEQVRTAGGSLQTVAQEIHARIVAIDATQTGESDHEATMLQAERAFHVARLSYLEYLGNKASRA